VSTSPITRCCSRAATASTGCCSSSPSRGRGRRRSRGCAACGVDTLTAVGLVAEIGDITAFKHPKQLSSYLGLVPSEQSSGERRRQGSITKAGSSHARRLLVEAAWHYRRPPRVSLTLKRRQDGQQPAAINAAWRAQLRLHRRWAHLDAARSKKRTTVAVAVARELACFVWEIAQQPE
jgi:transposase